MPRPPVSPQSSSSPTSAVFVDAEDLWRSAAPSIASSRNSTAVIPPHFPPRGVRRLLSALRLKLPGMLQARKDEYRDHVLPSTLSTKPHASSYERPCTHLRATHTIASSSTLPSSTSSGVRRPARHRRRHTRPRQNATPGVIPDATLIPNAPLHIQDPQASLHQRRTPSPHPDRLSARYIDKGTMTMPIYQPPAAYTTSVMPFAGRDVSASHPQNSLMSAIDPAEPSGSHRSSPERFRVFSLDGELAYVDAGKPYEETIRLARKAYPRLQDVEADRIQFFLPCSPAERARVPEDAWQGMIRRTRSLDRVFVHIKPEESGSTREENGTSSLVPCDNPVNEDISIVGRKTDSQDDVDAS